MTPIQRKILKQNCLVEGVTNHSQRIPFFGWKQELLGNGTPGVGSVEEVNQYLDNLQERKSLEDSYWLLKGAKDVSRGRVVYSYKGVPAPSSEASKNNYKNEYLHVRVTPRLELQESQTGYQDRVNLVMADVLTHYRQEVPVSDQIREAMKSEFGTFPSQEELPVLVDCANESIKALNLNSPK